MVCEEDLRTETDQRMTTLIQNILEGINDFVVHGHLVMKMGPGRKPPRTADPAQQIASLYLLAIPHENFGQMAIGRLNSMSMIDSNVISHPGIIRCHDHFAFGRGADFFPFGRNNIHTRMERPLAGKRRYARPKL